MKSFNLKTLGLLAAVATLGLGSFSIPAQAQGLTPAEMAQQKANEAASQEALKEMKDLFRQHMVEFMGSDEEKKAARKAFKDIAHKVVQEFVAKGGPKEVKEALDKGVKDFLDGDAPEKVKEAIQKAAKKFVANGGLEKAEKKFKEALGKLAQNGDLKEAVQKAAEKFVANGGPKKVEKALGKLAEKAGEEYAKKNKAAWEAAKAAGESSAVGQGSEAAPEEAQGAAAAS